MLRDFFGSGERWGVKIDYLHEQAPLGTAGSLSLLRERPTDPIIVMNSDLLTHIRFDNLLHFHFAHQAVATMGVRQHDFQVPYGVVGLNGHQIQYIDEKPTHKFFINAGVYVLSPQVLDYLPNQLYLDMPVFFEDLIARRQNTIAYPIQEYWLDIGRIEEFERARVEWSGA